MLQYKRQSYFDHEDELPPLAVLLSCYDELHTEQPPRDYSRAQLPMLDQYLSSHWPSGKLRFSLFLHWVRRWIRHNPTMHMQPRGLRQEDLL